MQRISGLDQISLITTVGDAIQWGADHFEDAGLYFGHGTDNPWDEAVSLVLHALSLPWNSDSDVLNQVLTEKEKTSIAHLYERRINEQIPAAYLIGEAWFAGLKFVVDSRVLVPRSPIAELIENAFLPWLPKAPSNILDLCTGSGCIGIACAHTFPEAKITLIDISADALAVAEQNITLHQLSDRVKTAESDLFAGLGTGLKKSSGSGSNLYDLIVTNPPYVDFDDLASMPKEYHHEPEIGLASGNDGLDFTRRLLREAINHLSETGILIVEVGNSWHALEQAFPNVPFLWLEFERGGHGVFMLTVDQLREYRQEFL